jgi:hypothetical protein
MLSINHAIPVHKYLQQHQQSGSNTNTSCVCSAKQHQQQQQRKVLRVGSADQADIRVKELHVGRSPSYMACATQYERKVAPRKED